ncbi:MAG: GNAT family N-acetyltransferase [Polyangiaceae bacterium]|nr:GNAT family N-acetyltransferase [Polyangiaceae bacterium]
MSSPAPLANAPPPSVRAATRDDLPEMARLAAQLVRLHHEFDPLRFFVQEPIEPGYTWWFGRELQNPSAVLLVAEQPSSQGPRIVGYAYGCLEERDWNALLDACAYLHDILVTPEARQTGVAAQLLETIAERFKEKGAPRMVLQTATNNIAAQRLFKKHGFREIMIEMTRELGFAFEIGGHDVAHHRARCARPGLPSVRARSQARCARSREALLFGAEMVQCA